MTLNVNKQVWINLGIICLILIGLFAGIWYFRSVFRYVFIALIMFYFIKPLMNWLEKAGIKKGKALAVIGICFLILMMVIIKILVPIILIEIENFNKNLPEIKQRVSTDFLQGVYDDQGNLIAYYSPLLDTKFETETIESAFNSFIEQLKSSITSSLSIFLSSIVLVPLLMYLFIREGDKLKKKFFNIIPNKYFEVSLSMFHEIDKSVGNFISAKLIESAIVGLVATLGFFLVGLKLPYLMGLLVGIFNIIPYLGPFLGAIPPLALGYLLGNEKTVFFVLGVIIVAQLIDNIVLQPFLIPKMIKEHPLIVILVTLIGASLLGPLGMIIAVPVFSIIKTVLIKSYQLLDIVYSRKEVESYVLD